MLHCRAAGMPEGEVGRGGEVLRRWLENEPGMAGGRGEGRGPAAGPGIARRRRLESGEGE